MAWKGASPEDGLAVRSLPTSRGPGSRLVGEVWRAARPAGFLPPNTVHERSLAVTRCAVVRRESTLRRERRVGMQQRARRARRDERFELCERARPSGEADEAVRSRRGPARDRPPATRSRAERGFRARRAWLLAPDTRVHATPRRIARIVSASATPAASERLVAQVAFETVFDGSVIEPIKAVHRQVVD